MKNRDKAILLAFSLGSAIGCGGGGESAAPNEVAEGARESRMIGSDRRKAVYFESWYALRSSFLTTPNDQGPTGGLKLNDRVASDWNYLGNDPNAYARVKEILGSNSSVSSYFGTGDDYGKHSSAGVRYGRGGQCTYFACLILFRALNGFKFNSNTSAQTDVNKGRFVWADLDTTKYPSASVAQPGDLVFTKTGTWHIAVCVGKPNSTTMEIVESNYTGYGNSTYSVGTYNGSYNSELIARRTLSTANYYAIPGDNRYSNLKHRRWY